MNAYRPSKAGTAALAALLAAATMSGCSDARRALGYDKSPPDEFSVVARAPLSQPPDFNLRPPAPGAPRPQEGTSSDQARSALTPGKTLVAANLADRSAGEKLVLAKSGADKASPDIRRMVNEDASAEVEASDSFTEKLIFWRTKPLPGEIVNPQAEAKRLQDNASLGKSPIAGESVKIERRDKALLEDIF